MIDAGSNIASKIAAEPLQIATWLELTAYGNTIADPLNADYKTAQSKTP